MKQLRRQKRFVRASSAPAHLPTIRERQLQRQVDALEARLQKFQQQQQQEEQEETRECLAEAVRRYEQLHDLAPVSFLALDRRGRIIGLNQIASRLLGFPSGWLYEKPFLAFI